MIKTKKRKDTKMGWADTQNRKGGGGQLDDTHVFIKPNTTATLHILLKQGEEPLSYWTHYVNARTVICPGRSACPVCKAGKYKSRKKHAINVWDYVSNSVKILEQGQQVMQQLKLILDQYKTFDNVDVVVKRIGEGRDTQYMATPVSMTKPFTLTPEIEKGKYNLQYVKTPTEPAEIEKILDSDSFNPASFQASPPQEAPQSQATSPEPSPTTAPQTDAQKPLVLEFGKYITKTLAEVAKTDISYVKWCAANVSDFALRAEAQRVVQEHEVLPKEAVKTTSTKETLIGEAYQLINNDPRYKSNFALVVEKMKMSTRNAINPNGKTLVQDYTEEELKKLLETLKQ